MKRALILILSLLAVSLVVSVMVIRHRRTVAAQAVTAHVKALAVQQEAQRQVEIAAAEAAAAQRQTPHVKVLVTPFENGGAARSLSAYSLGLPAHVAERLEDDGAIEPINGPYVLTKVQARLVDPFGMHYDLAKANALALSKGAAYFLTGRFSGQVWTWTFEADVYAAGTDGPALVGKAVETGDITDEVTTASGRKIRTNSAARIFAMTGKAVADAFDAAHLALAPETRTAISTPPTKDAFAFLKLARAYARFFAEAGDGSDDTAIGLAKVAAVIDPSQSEAQRFYAALLMDDDEPRLARIHYEFAVAAKPKDYRSLLALGRLEYDANNPDIARGYLSRASLARPHEAEPQYWLGMAYLKIDKADDAVAAFEAARTIDGGYVEARQELAELYSTRQRWADAANEAAAIAEIRPLDADAVYLQAACLRRAGRTDEARDALGNAMARFPKDARMRKFRGDLYLHDGDLDRATAEYRAAAALASGDPRMRAVFGPSPVSDAQMPLGGDALIASIASSADDMTALEAARSSYQGAINDAIADLHLNGEKACVDGRAPSAAILARQMGKRYREVGSRLIGETARIGIALRGGEGSALTPDELAAAKQAITDAGNADHDAREMVGQFMHVFVPLYRRFACETYDGPLTAATDADIRTQDADRQVRLPLVPPSPWLMSFSPQIEPQTGMVVRFVVDNREGHGAQALTVDDKEIDTIPPGSRMTFTTEFGYHRVCLLPKGEICGIAGTVRLPFIHDGWTIRVRQTK